MTTLYRNLVACLGMAIVGAALLAPPVQAQTHQRVLAKDGSGVPGYKDTPVQPWSGFHVHDPDRPQPPRVAPGDPGTQKSPGTAPSDAIVLFDGTRMDQWNPSKWKVEDGLLIATDGLLTTKKEFGDCQLHLEWRAPVEKADRPTNQGNNGVQFLESIEVQIFDSDAVKLYPDGQAASIYSQTPPLVNSCRKAGQWQTFDIVFVAPRFDDAGKLQEPARLTMFHNGLLVHHNQQIYGGSPHAGLAGYESIKPRGPVALMAHHCPVAFRNIWIRPNPLGDKAL